jgi:hypothetical protein
MVAMIKNAQDLVSDASLLLTSGRDATQMEGICDK